MDDDPLEDATMNAIRLEAIRKVLDELRAAFEDVADAERKGAIALCAPVTLDQVDIERIYACLWSTNAAGLAEINRILLWDRPPRLG
jgi:hypothetical protein